ncbi:MAG: hypothetical protein HQK69_02910, partial [Desulfamplus sp.]|nr:hypothetical protein [Desulfamplus sp.]
ANTSIIKIIQSVTDSINAFVQTNADTNTNIGATGVKKLYIKPTYKANAWNWGNITPSVVLNDSVCREIGRSNINYSVVNNVIVSGENQGVAVNATREGTAGDKPASSITEPLITTREAGVERARHIISKSGAWVNHTLSLFSLLPPNSSLPLLLAGDFIQMNESGNLWIGQVTGNSIQSGWTNEGLKTTQTITVEQYIGE